MSTHIKKIINSTPIDVARGLDQTFKKEKHKRQKSLKGFLRHWAFYQGTGKVVVVVMVVIG